MCVMVKMLSTYHISSSTLCTAYYHQNVLHLHYTIPHALSNSAYDQHSMRHVRDFEYHTELPQHIHHKQRTDETCCYVMVTVLLKVCVMVVIIRGTRCSAHAFAVLITHSPQS